MKEHTHYEEKFSLNFIFLIILLVLSLYGFYKNGLIYFFNNQISFFNALKPLFLSLSGLLSGIIVDLSIYHKLVKNYLIGFMISIALPYQISLITSFIIITVILYLFSKFKLTFSPFYLIILILVFFINNNYANIIESSNEIFYQTIDIFLGKSIGGVGITNILLLLIAFLLFCFSIYYKKEISVVTIGTYLLLMLFMSVRKSDPNLFINLLNSSVFYLAIFIIPYNEYSPINKKWQIIYAVISGLNMFIGTFYFNTITGPFLGAFLANSLFYLLEILSKKKTFIAKI